MGVGAMSWTKSYGDLRSARLPQRRAFPNSPQPATWANVGAPGEVYTQASGADAGNVGQG
jgi:hypothetical protein